MENNKKTTSNNTKLADRKLTMFILIFCTGLFVISIILPPIFNELNDKTVVVSVIDSDETVPDTSYESNDYAEITESAAVSKAAVIFPLDINSATVDELMAVDGIGESIAENIVEYRTLNGCFYFMDELLNVNGIGSQKLEQLKSYFFVDTTVLTETTFPYTAQTEYPDVSAPLPETETEYCPDFSLKLN